MKAKVEVKVKAEATQTSTLTSTSLPHRPIRRHGTQRRTRLTAARGCDPKVLAKIRKDVFDISAPKP
jgi:hypothetical protein